MLESPQLELAADRPHLPKEACPMDEANKQIKAILELPQQEKQRLRK